MTDDQQKIENVVKEVQKEAIKKDLSVEEIEALLDKKLTKLKYTDEDTEDIVNKLMDKILAVIQDDIEKPAEKPTTEPAEKPTEKPAEKPADKKPEDTTDKEDSLFDYFR